ncbi:MAG: DUF2249 domain-containing protein [Deltaproteobacteria bacterium]|nr:DUF2249 domain-containing protein [Deltaproteobacteria bacterium]MBW2420987.1 DUF2249 domain-containing protein [Deltaproteobacteria bacterium]
MGITEERLGQGPLAATRSQLDAALQNVPDRGVLVLRLRFEPDEVMGLLTEGGYRVRVGAHARGEWTLAIQCPTAPEILDLRDLEAPEPLERILLEAAELPPGGVLLVRTPRIPRMLLPQLDRRGLESKILEEPDASGLVWVRRPA